MSAFYKNLNSSSNSDEKSDEFLSKIKQFIPKIKKEFKENCDKDLELHELDKAVMCLKLDKSPGSDGLTAHFYRHFWESIGDLLFQVFKETVNNLNVPTTMKQGILT